MLNVSSSGELSRTTSVATETSTSSTECFKSPVAPRKDLVITIEDDEDEELILDKATDGVVADIVTSNNDHYSEETCGKSFLLARVYMFWCKLASTR